MEFYTRTLISVVYRSKCIFDNFVTLHLGHILARNSFHCLETRELLELVSVAQKKHYRQGFYNVKLPNLWNIKYNLLNLIQNLTAKCIVEHWNKTIVLSMRHRETVKTNMGHL